MRAIGKLLALSPALTFGLLALLAEPASATMLQNGSFENPDDTWVESAGGYKYMAVGVGSTAIPGWTVSKADGDGIVWGQSPTGDGWTASDGVYFIDLSGYGTNAGDSQVEQLLHNLIVGETYTVSFDYFGKAADLLIGGSSLVAGGSLAYNTAGWTTVSRSFVANSENELLAFQNFKINNYDYYVFLDNVRVSGLESGNSVPEPSTLALFSLALGLAWTLHAHGRRRRYLPRQ